jgi:hypothetical protein
MARFITVKSPDGRHTLSINMELAKVIRHSRDPKQCDVQFDHDLTVTVGVDAATLLNVEALIRVEHT